MVWRMASRKLMRELRAARVAFPGLRTVYRPRRHVSLSCTSCDVILIRLVKTPFQALNVANLEACLLPPAFRIVTAEKPKGEAAMQTHTVSPKAHFILV